MKTIAPIITATVLALALIPASAASKHKRHTKAATASTATDCLHRRRLHAGSSRLPSRNRLYAVGNTNRF